MIRRLEHISKDNNKQSGREIITMSHHEEHTGWRKEISPYESPLIKQSVWQLTNTLVPFFALWYVAYLSLSISFWLTLVVAVPAGGFLIRIFIIFHDCCHKSFFKNKTANAVIGTLTGVLTCCPYFQWRYSHSVHHATNGNLNKRGTGDIWTLTLEEYVSLSFFQRLKYRIYRNPIILLAIGPTYTFLIDYRFNRKRSGIKERMHTYMTNLLIAGIVVLCCLTIGWQAFLLVQLPIFLISGAVGIWLFYIQHVFEESYFENENEWDYVNAAMKGSSFYKLPKILRWFTGNIGFHHIHHLSPRVPNYHLQKAHDNNPLLHNVSTITLWSSFQSLRYRVWDEKNKKFIGFKDIKKSKGDL
jgi:omega-6 fatty acid desaturase (delta-12 desaturase)